MREQKGLGIIEKGRGLLNYDPKKKKVREGRKEGIEKDKE